MGYSWWRGKVISKKGKVIELSGNWTLNPKQWFIFDPGGSIVK